MIETAARVFTFGLVAFLAASNWGLRDVEWGVHFLRCFLDTGSRVGNPSSSVLEVRSQLRWTAIGSVQSIRVRLGRSERVVPALAHALRNAPRPKALAACSLSAADPVGIRVAVGDTSHVFHSKWWLRRVVSFCFQWRLVGKLAIVHHAGFVVLTLAITVAQPISIVERLNLRFIRGHFRLE